MTDHDPDNEDRPEIELVMPFVTVTSKGGPHDDQSYCCGWAMGGLSALLGLGQPAVHETNIHTENIPQADLIAMDRGYTAKFVDSGVEGWTYAMFTRAAVAEVAPDA